jgi:hypothetical protein
MRYQPLQQELHQIQSALWLQLPTHPAALSAQVRQIDGWQQRLEHLQDLLPSRPRSSLDLALADLIALLIADAKSFKLLAEEYLIDPEGSISCLHSVLHASMQDRSRLWAEIAPSSLPQLQISPRCVKSSVRFRDEYRFPA